MLSGMAADTHYRSPGWFTRNVFNRSVAFLTRHGVSVLGSRVLAVKGRTSGVWRTTPVNLLEFDAHRYLVSPRGEGHWVRNLHVAGGGELRLGKKSKRSEPTNSTMTTRWRCYGHISNAGTSRLVSSSKVSDQTLLTNNSAPSPLVTQCSRCCCPFDAASS